MYVILSRVVILFALIFLGFLIGKKNVMKKEVTPELSNFLVSVTLPVTVFLSMVQPFNKELLQQSVAIFIAAAVFHFVTMLLGLFMIVLCRVPEKSRGVWVFTCMFSNNGFMGFPLALSVYGNDGMFLMAIANVVSNFLIFSLGMKLLTKYYPVSEKISLRKIVFNNINIAVVAGLIFYLFQIPVPGIVNDMLSYVGDLTAGLSMIVVGLSLSRIPLKTVMKGRDVWVISVLRLLIVPCVTAFAVNMIPAMHGKLMGNILVMMAALPAASSVSILTEQFGTNTELAAKTVFVSTLFSVVTIPVVMAFAF